MITQKTPRTIIAFYSFLWSKYKLLLNVNQIWVRHFSWGRFRSPYELPEWIMFNMLPYLYIILPHSIPYLCTIMYPKYYPIFSHMISNSIPYCLILSQIYSIPYCPIFPQIYSIPYCPIFCQWNADESPAFPNRFYARSKFHIVTPCSSLLCGSWPTLFWDFRYQRKNISDIYFQQGMAYCILHHLICI